MFLFNVIFLTVSSIASVASEEQPVGIVLAFAPTGDYKYMFSRHTNDILEDEYKKADFTIRAGDENIRIVCHRFLIDEGAPNEQESFRATLITADSVELESFQTISCRKEELYPATVASKTTINGKPNYFIYFKDTLDKCRRRTYVVSFIHENDDYKEAKVERSRAEQAPKVWRASAWGWGAGSWVDSCPPQVKEAAGIYENWYDTGELDNYSMYANYEIIALDGVECSNCFIMCKEVDDWDNPSPKYYVDLVLEKVPVDRIRTASCSEKNLRFSINADMIFQPEDDTYKGIVVNYINAEGRCYKRSYLYRYLLHQTNPFFEYAFVTRDKPDINDDCATMQYEGYQDQLIDMVKNKIFGRFMNNSIWNFCGVSGDP